MKTSTKPPIIILHGWAKEMSGKRYNGIKKLLEKKGYTVFAPDLLGFGTSLLNKNSLELDDYVQFVKQYIETKKLSHVILLGHSFGGRIAIKFAATYTEKLKALILTGASGIPRPLPSLKKKIVFVGTKIFRPLFVIPPLSLFFSFFRKLVYYSIGETDYYKSGNLSQTFKNVYKVSILSDLPHIKVPTLLVWGENDAFTPLADGREMERLIPGATLVVVKNQGHRLPYENPELFLNACTTFL